MELTPGTDLANTWKGPVVPTAWKLLAELRVQDPKASKANLAAALGYNQATVARWINDPVYQAYENFVITNVADELPLHLREERAVSLAQIQNRFLNHAEEMQDRLIELARTVDDPKVQAQIAQDFLDRAGVGSNVRNQSSGLQMHLNIEHIEMFFSRLGEAFGTPKELDAHR